MAYLHPNACGGVKRILVKTTTFCMQDFLIFFSSLRWFSHSYDDLSFDPARYIRCMTGVRTTRTACMLYDLVCFVHD